MNKPMRIAIIGSFQRFPKEIKDFAEELTSFDLEVNSLKLKFIIKDKEGTVYFDADPQNYTSEEIQMIVLNDLLQSDLVYVYNPTGICESNTLYEIGFCLSRKKKIFYYEKPSELPIPIDKNQLVKPYDFFRLVKDSGSTEIDYSSFSKNICAEALGAYEQVVDLKVKNKPKEKRLVICGSMAFFDEMSTCKTQLETYGIHCIVPKNENIGNFRNEKEFDAFKRKVSRAYLSKVRSKSTLAVLIYNETKNGQKCYIGANTQAELAMAFAFNKPIFLYDDIYYPLSDELNTWECIALRKDFFKLIQFWKENHKQKKLLQ